MVSVSDAEKQSDSAGESPTTPTNQITQFQTDRTDSVNIDVDISEKVDMKPRENGSVVKGNGKSECENRNVEKCNGLDADRECVEAVKDLKNNPDYVAPQNGKKIFSSPTDKEDAFNALDRLKIRFKGNEDIPNKDVKKKKPKKDDVPKVGFFELFRFSGKLDKLMMLVGTLAAMGAGCIVPLNFIIYGNVATVFILDVRAVINQTDASPMNSTAVTALFSEVSVYALYFCGVALALWPTIYLGISMWTMAAESQMKKIRCMFFRAILRQEIAWFDTQDSGELGSRMTDDLVKIGDGMGDKMAMFIQWITVFVAGYVMALISEWKLALAVMSISPLLILISAFVGKVMRFYSQKEILAYAKAGAVAEEVLSAIRTVAAFHGEDKEAHRYSSNLHTARKLAIRKSFIMGFGSGAFWLMIFIGFSIAFIYGMLLFQDGQISPGIILQVFFAVLVGSFSLGHAVPNLETIAVARAAATTIFDIIDREPSIDSFSESGDKPGKIEGNVEFRGVHFSYPSRPNVRVLCGFDLEVSVGHTVALVGSSGSGKSTTVQLLQRFYDPVQGQVLLDGHDIKQLNVSWLRHQIGVVSQEPVLFATSIAENIRYGKLDVTQQEVEAAAKEANAHNFIMELPQKYETHVGERGAQLSGGQKQRIAIARALVRNPKVLLLDEATSALDTESEAIVQDALEKVQYGRTTIVIAHRLSTIINADKIVAIKDGVIVEQGSHAQLMAQQGFYHSLYQASNKPHPKPDDDSSATEDEGEEDTRLLMKPLFRGDSRMSMNSLRRNISGLSELPFRDEGEQEESPEIGKVSRIMRLNSPEWLFITVGCIAAVIVGGVHPMFAFVFSELLRVFSLKDPEYQLHQTYFLAGMMVGVGVILCIFKSIQHTCFGKSGANLTMRMRHLAFKSMLRQDMGWFDRPGNQTGILTTILANDTAIVEGATGVKIGTFMESAASIVVAMVIAFYFGWKLSFVVLAFFPIMIFSGIVQGKMLLGFAKGDRSSQISASKIALESIENIRTVSSLAMEKGILERYSAIFKCTYRKSVKKAHLYGLTYGFTQSVMYFAYAAAFSFGAYLVEKGEMEFFNVFRVLASIIFTGMTVGRTNSFAPDFSKAKIAAGKLFALFDNVPEIDVESKEGKVLDEFAGRLSLQDVKFRYPTRLDVRVLRGLDLELSPGETVALVGTSGCGKSTVVQLVERFYNPLNGDLLYDGHEGRELNVNWLRRQIGIVSQEPVLFDCSITENIAYGDNSRQIPMEEIIAAARAANIHNFISSLPQGYDTIAGDKGGQLSGGQKQRVAIARALVRNPKILLLDEATSALDTESERVVQEALDKARKGRTCIIIAHRLSTVQTADRIAVIHQGRVVEQGTHHQLMARKSHYYNLNNTRHSVHKRKSEATL